MYQWHSSIFITNLPCCSELLLDDSLPHRCHLRWINLVYFSFISLLIYLLLFSLLFAVWLPLSFVLPLSLSSWSFLSPFFVLPHFYANYPKFAYFWQNWKLNERVINTKTIQLFVFVLLFSNSTLYLKFSQLYRLFFSTRINIQIFKLKFVQAFVEFFALKGVDEHTTAFYLNRGIWRENLR